jgi:hypothetical protein
MLFFYPEDRDSKLLFQPEVGGTTYLQNVGKFYQTTRSHILDYSNPYSYRHENLLSYRHYH